MRATNVDFTASAVGGTGPFQYEFFVNGGSVQGPSATLTYSTTALVDGDVVTVTVTDANTCNDTHAGITMTVNDNPVAGLTSTATAICAGDNVDFTSSATGGTTPYQYEFFVNGGSVQGPSPVTIYSTTTLVDGDVVTVTATDANGCLDTHAGITMTVYDNPIAGLTSTATAICAGDNVDFTASATSGTTPYQYEFFVNGGSVQGPGAATMYSTMTLVDGDVVTVEVTDVNGCTDTHAGITMTVYPVPTAVLNSVPVSATICAGDNVDFTASAIGGTGPFQYEFFVNGGSVQGPSATLTYTTTALVDGDVVTVTVTDANTCNDTHAGITMTVNDNPVAGLTSTATAICAGDNVDFTASATSGTTPYQYEFFVNGVSRDPV